MSLICIIYEFFMKNNKYKLTFFIVLEKEKNMLTSIESIIELHNNKGLIEDAYIDIHFDNKILKLNTYTLKFTNVNADKEEVKMWNNRINYELKKNRNLEKEIKEFRILFEALNKLKIKKGYIKKTERPDFVLDIDNIFTEMTGYQKKYMKI